MTSYPASDHYNPHTRRFHAAEPPRPLQHGLAALWKMIIHGRHTYPPVPLPSLRPDWATFFAPAAKSRFIWFGHSTLLMRIGGQTLITDPVFGGNVSPVPFTMRRFQPPAATVVELPPLDVVLISHNHYDHLERATHKRLAHGHAHYLVPLGVGVQLQRWGIPAARISEMDWWQSIERNGIRYTALPARHYSGRGMFDHNRSLWAGYLIEYDNERYYFHASATLTLPLSKTANTANTGRTTTFFPKKPLLLPPNLPPHASCPSIGVPIRWHCTAGMIPYCAVSPLPVPMTSTRSPRCSARSLTWTRQAMIGIAMRHKKSLYMHMCLTI